MNYEKKTRINENVINSYFQVYKEYLINLIENDIENSIEIKLCSEEYLYINLNDSKAIIFKKKNNCIYDIIINEYTDFISDDFLESFNINIDRFSIRLKRIIKDKSRLRVEIIENIKLKNILIFYDKDSGKCFADWKKYDLTMYLDKNFEFEYIAKI